MYQPVVLLRWCCKTRIPLLLNLYIYLYHSAGTKENTSLAGVATSHLPPVLGANQPHLTILRTDLPPLVNLTYPTYF